MRGKLDPYLSKNLEKWHEAELKPEDLVYEKYMELRANPPLENGVPNWDKWSDNSKAFLSKQPTEIQDYIKTRQMDYIQGLPQDRQQIEKLIMDCESVLDEYYALPEGEARLAYRDANPQVDARLVLLRDLKPQNQTTIIYAYQLLNQYGISQSIMEGVTPRAITPRPTPKRPGEPESTFLKIIGRKR